VKKYVLLYQKKKKEKRTKEQRTKEQMSTPVFRMNPGAFIDRFLVGADRPRTRG
jgi:hypothetical protein